MRARRRNTCRPWASRPESFRLPRMALTCDLAAPGATVWSAWIHSQLLGRGTGAMPRTRWSASGAWPGVWLSTVVAREDGLVDGISPGAAGLGAFHRGHGPLSAPRNTERPRRALASMRVAILANEQQCRATSKLPNRPR